MKLTYKMLQDAKACYKGLTTFKNLYPNGFEFTKKNFYNLFDKYSINPNAYSGLSFPLTLVLGRDAFITFNSTWLRHVKKDHKPMVEFIWNELKKQHGSKITRRKSKEIPKVPVITLAMIEAHDPCKVGSEMFSKYFPNGIEVTEENILKVLSIMYGDSGWFVEKFLGNELYSRYDASWLWRHTENHPAMAKFIYKNLKKKGFDKLV